MQDQLQKITSKLLANLNKPGEYYSVLHQFFDENVEQSPVIFYQPAHPADLPFDSNEQAEAKIISGDLTTPENSAVSVIQSRDSGLTDENFTIQQFASNNQWYGALETPEPVSLLEESSTELLIDFFETMVESNRQRHFAKTGEWINAVRKLIEENSSINDLTDAIVSFAADELDANQVGFYSIKNNHYTLQANYGFEENDKNNRNFFPRDQLTENDIQSGDYLVEKNLDSDNLNVFVPLNTASKREGLLVFFESLGSNQTLSRAATFKIRSLQSLLSMGLATSRHSYDGNQEFIRDELTALHNSEYYRQRFKEEIERAVRYHTDLSALVLEIENLNSIESKFGESAKVEALKRVSQLIQNTFRMVDVACRFDNNQFGIIYPNTAIKGALTAVQRFDELAQDSLMNFEETEVQVKINGGLASYPEDGESPEELLKQARLALYEAKQSDEVSLKTSQEIESDHD